MIHDVTARTERRVGVRRLEADGVDYGPMAGRLSQTRYAQSSGAKIAYQVSGTGPPDRGARSPVPRTHRQAEGCQDDGRGAVA